MAVAFKSTVIWGKKLDDFCFLKSRGVLWAKLWFVLNVPWDLEKCIPLLMKLAVDVHRWCWFTQRGLAVGRVWHGPFSRSSVGTCHLGTVLGMCTGRTVFLGEWTSLGFLFNSVWNLFEMNITALGFFWLVFWLSFSRYLLIIDLWF